MRLFVAVTPKNLKENQRLTKIYSKIRRTLGDREEPVRFTPPNMWHVTVTFLGEQTQTQCNQTIELLKAWEPREKFELEYHGLGAFPDVKEGRVLWVGVRKNQAFFDLQQSLEETFIKAGILEKPDREFKPHLTLVRFRHLRNLNSLIQLGAKADFGSEPIEDLVLFESVTQGSIPKYVPKFTKSL